MRKKRKRPATENGVPAYGYKNDKEENKMKNDMTMKLLTAAELDDI